VQVVRITDLPKGNAEHATPLGLDALAGALRSAVLPGQSVTVSEREVGVGQGLTIVHFSVQPELFLTQNTP